MPLAVSNNARGTVVISAAIVWLAVLYLGGCAVPGRFSECESCKLGLVQCTRMPYVMPGLCCALLLCRAGPVPLGSSKRLDPLITQ